MTWTLIDRIPDVACIDNLVALVEGEDVSNSDGLGLGMGVFFKVGMFVGCAVGKRVVGCVVVVRMVTTEV